MFCVRQSSVRGCRFSFVFVYFIIKVITCSPVPASFFLYLRTLLHWCRNPGRGSRYAIMQPAQPTPLAELVKSLAGLHQAQHQALMDMKLEQEDRFRLLVQAQDEDRRAIRSLLGREETPIAAPSIAHVPLIKMGPHDDPEAFVDLFEKTAEACGWARSQWPVRLIPLLTGEAQVAAQQLPVANLLAYDDLKRAILQRVGRNPEQHRQRFRSVELGDCGRPFVMAQQLRDACRKWLLAEPRDVEGVIDLEVLEQFVARLPRRTAEWVQCHRPTSLAQAIQLAEDHLAACPGVGEPRPTLSLSLSLPPSLQSPSLSRPVPAPRSRLPVAPRAPPQSGNGQADRYPRRGGGPRAHLLSTVLSPAIPCPPFCRWGGGKAWAGLLEMQGPGALPGPLSHDGGGIAGPGPRLPGGCPRSSWAVPDTCEYQGGYISGLGGFGL